MAVIIRIITFDWRVYELLFFNAFPNLQELNMMLDTSLSSDTC